jgi:RNA polymerase sigma-70 factor (ECF subfamily)
MSQERYGSSLDAPASLTTTTAAGEGEREGANEAEAPRARRNDEERFVRIAVDHYDFVWRVLRRAGLPPSAADDATQQVFLVASRRVADIAEGAERAFLYRTASLIALDARRRRARRRESAEEPAVLGAADPAPGPEELTERKRMRALLDEAMSDLDDDLREVFALFELDAMPVPEIAALLEIPEGTCASRLRRAREQFKAIVARLQARGRRKGGASHE